MITSLLQREGHLLTEVSCETWEELVDLLSEPLLSTGAVEPSFVESAKEAVRQFGAYVVLIDDIAFFHGRPEAGVRELSMTLGLLQKPVYLKEKRILAAFLFAALDNKSHRGLLKGLSQLLNDDACLALLREGKDPAAILKKCKEVEERHEV